MTIDDPRSSLRKLGEGGQPHPATAIGQPMRDLYWMKTSEAFPDQSWAEPSFTCFDPAIPERKSDSLWHTYIGVVHQEPHGPHTGKWAWGVTVSFPGPRLPFRTSGREATRDDASRRVVECYEGMLRFYGRLC